MRAGLTERGRIWISDVITLQTNSDVIKATSRLRWRPMLCRSSSSGRRSNDLAPSFGSATRVVQRWIAPRRKQPHHADARKSRSGHSALRAARYGDVTPCKWRTTRARAVQAETSLAMVDLAVFSLLDRMNLPIADQFYGERGLGIRTGVSLVYRSIASNVKLAEEARAAVAVPMRQAVSRCAATSRHGGLLEG